MLSRSSLRSRLERIYFHFEDIVVSFQRPQHEKQIKGNNTPPHHIATHPVQSDPIRFDAIQFHFESESESVEQSRALLQLLIKPKSNQLLDVFVLANRRGKKSKRKAKQKHKRSKKPKKNNLSAAARVYLYLYICIGQYVSLACRCCSCFVCSSLSFSIGISRTRSWNRSLMTMMMLLPPSAVPLSQQHPRSVGLTVRSDALDLRFSRVCWRSDTKEPWLTSLQCINWCIFVSFLIISMLTYLKCIRNLF